MTIRFASKLRSAGIVVMAVLALAGSAAAPAQVQPVDPDKAIDGDLAHSANAPASVPTPVPAASPVPDAMPANQGAPTPTPTEAPADPNKPGTTYKQDDLIGAAEGVFGKGAKGVAGVIQDILKKQGDAYIVGREGGGALVVGVRYGSGTLFHKVEGQRPVYWTGPSIGFDAGASAGSTFVLVYNLYNTDDLYHRFPAGEGQAYLVGGFNVSYMRRGNIVLIPVRSGVGLRLGVNAGYMKFSQKHKWLPF
jgi:hypothetical protein